LRDYHCEIKAISQEACAKAEAMLKAQVEFSETFDTSIHSNSALCCRRKR
jgi:hypothetical protein